MALIRNEKIMLLHSKFCTPNSARKFCANPAHPGRKCMNTPK